MSPRAACRLEALGFQEVYDYVPGKVDWLARGLPRQGAKATEKRAVDVVRHDVVTVRLNQRMADVRPRVGASPYGFALVVAQDGTVLGRLRKAALHGEPGARVEEVMEPGPATVRADTSLNTLRERLDERDLTTAVVTTPEGVLMGMIRRKDL